MDSLTSAEAAARLGVPLSTFHRKYAPQMEPVAKAPGLRGACFWDPSDVDQLARELAGQPMTGRTAS